MRCGQMPEGAREGILRGIYRLKQATGGKAVVQLFGTGPILNEVRRAQEILAKVRSEDGRVERDQLQRAVASCAGCGVLEPSAPGKSGEDTVHCVGAEQDKGADYRGNRLYEGGGGIGFLRG